MEGVNPLHDCCIALADFEDDEAVSRANEWHKSKFARWLDVVAWVAGRDLETNAILYALAEIHEDAARNPADDEGARLFVALARLPDGAFLRGEKDLRRALREGSVVAFSLGLVAP